MYRELGAELKIDNELIVGPVESFKKLLTDQPAWIRDLIKFVQFAPDKQTYNQIDITIEDVLKAHNKRRIFNSSLRWISQTHAPTEIWIDSIYGRRCTFSNDMGNVAVEAVCYEQRQ